jgi:hypothetical protein
MFNILVDTCVWLDIAKDPRQTPVLGVVEEMVRQKLIVLMVPGLLLDEFRRNRQRIATDSAKSLATHFRLVKDAVDRVGGSKRRINRVRSYLDDVSHKVPIVGGSAVTALDRVEKLLTAAPGLIVNDAIRLRAAQRAVQKRAPFHRDKNAMADAILIESYAESLQRKMPAGSRFAFVTHNKTDFSVVGGNQKLPHPDFAEIFSRVKSRYFINLPEALRRVSPSLISDVMFEHSWTQEPRGLTEILKAEDLLFDQVWYNRHQNLRYRVERGQTKLVERETFPVKDHTKRPIQRNVWGTGSARSPES